MLTVNSEGVASCPEFRRLDDIAGIAVDLRYARPGNIWGKDLYQGLDCAWLHRDAASALEASVAWLAEYRPGATLLILDALRPQRVQEQLWEALQGTDLVNYLAEPSRGSIHSFGMALDLTVLGEDGIELDMGTAFDDLSERSHPALEGIMLARGDLTQEQFANRQLLRNAMLHSGWVGINSEWWHFDCGDRELVRLTYRRVL
jgi:D-alanyl-D-alanine dipeptidase